MEIKFEKDYLRELFYDGVASDKQHRFQPEIVRKYVRVVNILDSVNRVVDLYRYVPYITKSYWATRMALSLSA